MAETKTDNKDSKPADNSGTPGTPPGPATVPANVPASSADLAAQMAAMEKRLAESEARAAEAERQIAMLAERSEEAGRAGQVPTKKRVGPLTINRTGMTEAQAAAIKTFHVSSLNKEMDQFEQPVVIEGYTSRDVVTKFKDAVGIEPYKLIGVKAVEIPKRK